MTTLTAFTDLAGSHLDETPRREQRAWLDMLDPVILQTALTRTAVIRRLPDRGERELVALARIFVDADTLVWQRLDDDAWVIRDRHTIRGGDTMRARRERGRLTARARKNAVSEPRIRSEGA